VSSETPEPEHAEGFAEGAVAEQAVAEQSLFEEILAVAAAKDTSVESSAVPLVGEAPAGETVVEPVPEVAGQDSTIDTAGDTAGDAAGDTAEDTTDETADDAPTPAASLELKDIPGLGRGTAEKLRAVGISTVDELALVDPRELAVIIAPNRNFRAIHKAAVRIVGTVS
jgi:predicted flap endonuclease-1-like 5' DNA nuclease